MDNGHVMTAFFKNISNNRPIWADGPNELCICILDMNLGSKYLGIKQSCVHSPGMVSKPAMDRISRKGQK